MLALPVFVPMQTHDPGKPEPHGGCLRVAVVKGPWLDNLGVVLAGGAGVDLALRVSESAAAGTVRVDVQSQIGAGTGG